MRHGLSGPQVLSGRLSKPPSKSARSLPDRSPMISPGFVLRRLSHLPFHPGTR
ncbi:hypothetical protein ACGF0J_19885 [Nonomuraea sp. NPDC047897]|uniref:hypothetical protein n=1 Tax=Nonomuraea sp. NPDC047897 TaxID=3364346 RepID=UPI00371B0359